MLPAWEMMVYQTLCFSCACFTLTAYSVQYNDYHTKHCDDFMCLCCSLPSQAGWPVCLTYWPMKTWFSAIGNSWFVAVLLIVISFCLTICPLRLFTKLLLTEPFEREQCACGSSVIRALDPWSNGPRFKSLPERWENFSFPRSTFCTDSLIWYSFHPPCYHDSHVKDPGRSELSSVHTPLQVLLHLLC